MILYKYFAREVYTSLFTVTALILVISVAWRFNGYLADAAGGQLTREVLFPLIFFKLPGFLELVIPVSFFLALMLTYGRLYADSEMVVLQMSGFSNNQLVRMTLVLALGVTVICALLSLWIKPVFETRVEALFQSQKTITEFATLAPGRFQPLRSGNRVTYSEEIIDGKELRGVFISEADPSDPTSSVVTIAEQGRSVVDAEGKRFLVLQNGTRHRGAPGEADYQIISFGEFGQLLPEREVAQGERRRSALSMQELLDNFDQRNGSEFHWRLAMIIVIPVIALLAIPLSKVNPRQGRFNRLIPGLMICLVYIMSLAATRNALENGSIPLAIGMWGVHASAMVLVAALYYWNRRQA
jgi:lipopolysaccharide export system permease protein